jgi:zinc and cadmium transporter
MLAMFFVERFFSFHHHDVSDGDHHAHDDHGPGVHAPHNHVHENQPRASDLSWSGAALGLAFHSILNGVALAAAVQCETSRSSLAGLGTFLVIALHKPFDAMTISMLMGRSGWSLAWRHTINALFSLAIPIGVLVFYFGLMPDASNPNAVSQQWFVACVLSFSAGTFLCISLSDLLPELQFHQHDRAMLSAALLLGLAFAHVAAWLESAVHPPHQVPSGTASANK